MSAYTQILYQLVFCTKYRNPTLVKKHREDLFGCMHQIISNKNCICYQIEGIEDHLHFVFSLHPSIALANLVKDIKLGSTSFIKEKNLFPNFEGWQSSYAAFTYSFSAKNNLIAYVKNQEQHHQQQNSIDELKQLLKEFEIAYDERYFV